MRVVAALSARAAHVLEHALVAAGTQIPNVLFLIPSVAQSSAGVIHRVQVIIQAHFVLHAFMNVGVE